MLRKIYNYKAKNTMRECEQNQEKFPSTDIEQWTLLTSLNNDVGMKDSQSKQH